MLNRKVVLVQTIIFSTQWLLMLAGFYLLALIIAPARIADQASILAPYLEGTLKATLALVMSIFWLFIWHRQVRALFRKLGQQSA